ncbi:hypothetical protein DUNSADRAFT_1278 [Dunaliella salina]|uniref:Agenet domain-containing protein n=1 Tax=Dunaliella salina TaxID=3046 RepID=A0ABQ7GXB7_DUNSA|nr:hypothetical protein DUNSADRAFT_1278 [Dunaliella salina]|eukprot:KAF5839244.1 hypothetical protein DUNSADRAFT_1278 [Dunaliella salina]
MRQKSTPKPSRNGSEDSLEQHTEELRQGRSRAGAKRGRDTPAEDVLGIVGCKMRVWWCPTEEESKTDYSGAWWPVRVMAKGPGPRYMVKYDNGETGSVLAVHLSPYEVPMDFGKEALPLQVTEFCEVFNGSSTDPCAWAACVSKSLRNGEYTVRYPFHDTEPEKIPASRIRRLRVLEGDTWKLLRPNQHWRGGEVTSPMELETIDEEELGVYVDLSRVLQQTHEAVGKAVKEGKDDKVDNKDKESKGDKADNKDNEKGKEDKADKDQESKGDKADNKDKESQGGEDKKGEGNKAEESKGDKDKEEDANAKAEAPNKKSKQ